MKSFIKKTIASIRKIFIKNPCIIIMNDGGFGSQINKYLVGKYLEKCYQVPVKHDLSWFEEYGKSVDGKQNRNFDLKKVYPELKLLIASKQEVYEYKKYFSVKQESIFDFPHGFAAEQPPLYVDGYVVHHKYYEAVKEELNELLNFGIALNENTKQYLDKIANKDEISVAVHIRRGDYVGTVHDVLDEKYYIAAINKMRECLGVNITFYFFSNGFDWVETEIIPYINNIRYELVKGNDNDSGYFDFLLMGKCDHQIVSNSSLSWIAAYANSYENKKVIVPQIWFNNMDCREAFFFPGCTVMNTMGEIRSDKGNAK